MKQSSVSNTIDLIHSLLFVTVHAIQAQKLLLHVGNNLKLVFVTLFLSLPGNQRIDDGLFSYRAILT